MSLSITCPVFIVRFISAAAGWPANCVSVQLSFRPGTELASAFKGVPDPSLKVYFLAKSGFSAFFFFLKRKFYFLPTLTTVYPSSEAQPSLKLRIKCSIFLVNVRSQRRELFSPVWRANYTLGRPLMDHLYSWASPAACVDYGRRMLLPVALVKALSGLCKMAMFQGKPVIWMVRTWHCPWGPHGSGWVHVRLL